MKCRLFTRYALQGIRRGGQRGIIAILSVAFGVMSLVAMSTLSNEIMRVLLVDPHDSIGGDAQLWRDTQYLSPEMVEQIEQLHADGRIKQYTPAANSGALVLRTPGSGHISFLQYGIGLDPQSYPLLGEITLGEPKDATLKELLVSPGDVAITRDIAQNREISIGESILVTNQIGGAPVELQVTGIIKDTPGHQGNRIFYAMDTAQMITGQAYPVTDLTILWGNDPETTLSSLDEIGWKANTAQSCGDRYREMNTMFDFMLKGAGILSLIVGGIGIANTMQVLLARRTKEVAILKTLGYQKPAARRWLRAFGFYGLMAIPFAAISSLILGSVLQGIGVLLGTLAGLIGLGLLLGAVMWLALRLLPVFNFHLLRMARNKMRRRGFSLVFAMIALFIGVFTLGFAITVISSSMDEYANRSFSTEGYNIVVLAEQDQEEAILTALAGQPIDHLNVRYQAPIEAIALNGGEAVKDLPMLEGRADPWDLALDGAPWGSEPGGVYLPADVSLPLGTELIITGLNGQQRSVVVAGTYSPIEMEKGLIYPAGGIIASKGLFLELARDSGNILVAGEAPPARLTVIGDELGRALPDTTLVTSIDVDNIFSATLKSLFAFAVLMSGLALAAGAILIANAVSLAMIERQYEIGVLKAMGYAQWQVLTTIILEYGLIALIASVAGALGVELFIVVVQRVQETAGELLNVDLMTAITIVLVGAGLTLFAALVAAWQPSRARPLSILNRNT